MKKVFKLIENLDDGDFEFGDPINDETINLLENTIRRKLPESFKQFLGKYGWLEILGTEYLGYYGTDLNDNATFIGYTLEQQQKGLLKFLIIVQNNEDFGLACLDTSRMQNGECPIIIWDRWNNKIIEDTGMNFEEYMYNDIQKALDYK